MVVVKGSYPLNKCVAMKMAQTPIKSFSINSLLPETIEINHKTSEENAGDENNCAHPDVERIATPEDGDDDVLSDCDSSDLDVTSTTPPLDCSVKSEEGAKDTAEGKKPLIKLYCYNFGECAGFFLKQFTNFNYLIYNKINCF